MSRDRYGRPLRSPFDPSQVVPEIPERDHIEGLQAWQEALAYLEQDLPFHAHEVFEQRWRCAPAEERGTWRALAQWGAARTHLARGNAIGAQRVAERAAHTLARASVIPDYVDPAHVEQDCARLAKGAGTSRDSATQADPLGG